MSRREVLPLVSQPLGRERVWHSRLDDGGIGMKRTISAIAIVLFILSLNSCKGAVENKYSKYTSDTAIVQKAQEQPTPKVVTLPKEQII